MRLPGSSRKLVIAAKNRFTPVSLLFFYEGDGNAVKGLHQQLLFFLFFLSFVLVNRAVETASSIVTCGLNVSLPTQITLVTLLRQNRHCPLVSQPRVKRKLPDFH